jgi:bla regulator protein BlaR1
MMDYFITCTAISIFVWLAVILLKNAPAKISFYLMMFALVSWFVPWQLLPESAPTAEQVDGWFELSPVDLQSPVLTMPNRATPGQTQVVSLLWSWHFTWAHLFGTLFAVGAAVFLRRLHQYLLAIKALNINIISEKSSALRIQAYPVKVTQLHTPAIATGLFRPTIWIDAQLLRRPELDSVLLHESTHIRQGDILWLWLICLTESLFWWNPLCRMLARKARQFLELRCDESCFNQLKQQYQMDLASLLLKPLSGSSTQFLAGAPILNIVNNKDFNVLRVKMLNKEKVMKLKHLAILMAAVSISAVAAVQISETKAAAPVAPSARTANLSDAFQTQQASLLKAAAKAKSDDPAELQQVVANINVWHRDRTTLLWGEEQRMMLNAFTLLAHVQHKLGQHQEVISAFANWYPAGSKVPYFLRNITANTYLKLNQPQLALKELAILQQEIGDDIRPGSLYMLALAHTKNADYAAASQVLAHPNIIEDTYTQELQYYIYSQQNDVARRDLVKAKLPKNIASKPATLPKPGMPGSPLLALLSAA